MDQRIDRMFRPSLGRRITGWTLIVVGVALSSIICAILVLVLALLWKLAVEL